MRCIEILLRVTFQMKPVHYKGIPLRFQDTSGTMPSVKTRLRGNGKGSSDPLREKRHGPLDHVKEALGMISSPRDGSNGGQRAPFLCPRCHIHLKSHFLEDAPVEFCPECGGMWISREDFTRSIKRRPPPDLPEEEPPDAERPIWAESPLACPRCGGKMAKGVYDYSSGIKVDRCDGCRGIWLDRGELGRLRAYIQRKIPEEQLLMARLQAETVKRRIEAKYFAQESRSWWGGLSLRTLLERLRDLIGLQSRGR